ncbi:E3 ubiquitin-protein ligase [Stagonosporopsis vannaccii]|nr:E3 ubiquitin-protein ligase [Stagonosporopsis vannaccii]
MLLSRLQHLPGTLALALVVAAASATITPSNTSTVDQSWFQGTLPLQGPGDGQQIAELVPLTREGARRSVEGNLYRTNSSTVASISDGEIAYISCNPADYPGFVDAQGLFDQAYGNGNANISGIILYSTVTDYCDYEDDNNSMNDFPVLSMTNKTDSAAVLDQIDDLAVHMKYFVQVQGRGSSNGNGNNGNGFQPNPLGPSPSTAVAMIILYSITGIITALFLVIILTGAIRAHRHPERYGPRNVLGRPRQSRAKGLGRAILDTIPIIKFGEKEPAKPTDVELGSSSEARNTDDASSTTAAVTVPPKAVTATATDATETTANEALPPSAASTPNQPTNVEHSEGIAAAVAPSSAALGEEASKEENLGCSICTEDFEKGQDIRVLPCDHKFHPDCVDPWLLNVSGTCPLCRVDLRPTKTNESTTSQAEELAPPLNPDTENSHHRRAGLRDLLFFRSHPDAPAEDRISALRRLREQQRNQSAEVAEVNTSASAEDGLREDRRSRRISTRLGDVFSGRTRRGTSPPEPGNPNGSGS